MKKCCYDCEFIIDKDSRFCACGLTMYAGGYVSMILTDPKETVKSPCPLVTGNITMEAYEKYRKELGKRGIT
jgi:hypothetical protein